MTSYCWKTEYVPRELKQLNGVSLELDDQVWQIFLLTAGVFISEVDRRVEFI